MQQIAEIFVAERVITHVLYHAAGVRVGVGLLDVISRGLRESLQQQRTDLIRPCQINNLFVRQDRVRVAGRSEPSDACE